jgi:hypothetical protein
MYRVINLGSCRQDSLSKKFITMDVNKLISYPHSTKEILEVINFCKSGNLSDNETLYMFRTSLLNKKPLVFTYNLSKNFNIGDVYVLEITTNKLYVYNDKYLHHIAIDTALDENVRNNIKIIFQTKDEIEEDIIKIKEILGKPIVIISHLITQNKGRRYELSEWLRQICKKHSITYINPVEEFVKNNISLKNSFVREDKLAHYSEYGHNQISNIYYNLINKIS